ncbi:PHD finger protein 5a isoform X2 [Halictus rubicundus]|uniref:PHD finger protein 5a isoform X2 n=1 Tax=Halictus rubicundus TaxID=77578 RepID=UPI00403500C7
MASPGRRCTLTVEKRVELVKKLGEGSSIDSLAAEYNISRRTVRRYKQQAVSPKQFNSTIRAQSKQRRKPLYEKMEIRLHEWVLEKSAAGVQLTNALIQEKAKALVQERGTSSNFTASPGWVFRFKARYGIRLSKPDKMGTADEMATSRFIEDFNKMLEEENIEEDNIYNMDETSLLWRAVPWRTLVHKAIGRLCEKCDGKCVICDSYVRPCTLVRICDECNYGSYQGRCVICGGPGVSDAYYCKECTIQEKDRDGCPKIVNLGSSKTDLFYERKKYGFKRR